MKVLKGVEARPAGISSLAAKEVAKREAKLQEAHAQLVEAGLLFDKGKYSEALRLYRDSYDALPEAPLTAASKLAARDGYSRAANAEARRLAEAARYAEARALLKTVLEQSFNPGHEDSLKLLKQLDDPDRYNPALTPEHKSKVEQVSAFLRDGDALIALGDYDAALAKYQNALRLDAFNSAARRGMERVEQHKARYYEAARDQTRAKMLNDVGAGWEQQAPALDVASLFGNSAAPGVASSGKDSIIAKLNNIIIPVIDLSGASLDEVAEFLRIRSRELDPSRKGVGIVMKVSPELRQKPVTLSMAQVPLIEVLRYITEMTGTAFRVEEFAVAIISLAEKSDVMQVQKFIVPPTFISTAPAGGAPAGGAAAPVDPFAPAGGAAPAGGNTLVRRLGAKEFLESQGVPFPADATASYTPGTSTLFVRNTVQNLALIEALVDQSKSATARQVEIQVRLIEVNQNRLTELGFDWLLGQANVAGSSRVFAAGGTEGNQRTGAYTTADAPIGYPGTTIPVGVHPITSGLRGTGNILGGASIDALIGTKQVPPIDSKSPGIFAVAGVFTDPQFQGVIHALNNQKGLDVLASPAVVTRSGQRAVVTVIREFHYPTEFTPPTLPVGGGGGGGGVGGGGAAPVTVTPTTPSAFEKRDLGITLEVEPVVGENNRTIDLNLSPSSVDFEGFVNYGTPIYTSTPSLVGPPTRTLLTENKLLQPVFRSNKVTTSVTVWDGNTVVLGGVMSDRRIDINDKVPILGSIPLIGRAFQSKASSLEKRSVIFFVTVRVIDPGGQRVNQPAEPATVAR